MHGLAEWPFGGALILLRRGDQPVAEVAPKVNPTRPLSKSPVGLAAATLCFPVPIVLPVFPVPIVLPVGLLILAVAVAVCAAVCAAVLALRRCAYWSNLMRLFFTLKSNSLTELDINGSPPGLVVAGRQSSQSAHAPNSQSLQSHPSSSPVRKGL